MSFTMNMENQPLVIDEPIEWELWVEVQDFKKFSVNLKRIYQIYLKSIKKTW